jgi:hypothetical protein
MSLSANYFFLATFAFAFFGAAFLVAAAFDEAAFVFAFGFVFGLAFAFTLDLEVVADLETAARTFDLVFAFGAFFFALVDTFDVAMMAPLGMVRVKR